MTQRLIVRPEAEGEIAESFAWYEERRSGLGGRFLSSLEATLDSIQDNPFRFPLVHKALRRALMRRFPFGVFYVIEESTIVVLAIIHTHRDPRRWRERADDYLA